MESKDGRGRVSEDGSRDAREQLLAAVRRARDGGLDWSMIMRVIEAQQAAENAVERGGEVRTSRLN